MGGAGAACSRGMAAVSANPANLAFSRGVTLNLAGAAVDLHNNAFSLSRYNEFSGATLNDADKQRLLADIPAEGFALDGDAQASALGLQIGHFALSTRAFAAGRGNLDKDFFDLVLFGNEVGETVTFDDTWGEGHAVGAATLSFGQPIASGGFGRLALGFNASYLQGLYEVHVEEAGGQVTTAFDEISGDASATAVTSDGGTGYALDLGLSLQTPGGWSFGVAMDNVTSRLTWDGTPERHVFAVTAADLNAGQDDFDTAVVDSDTSYAVASYTTTLPATLTRRRRSRQRPFSPCGRRRPGDARRRRRQHHAALQLRPRVAPLRPAHPARRLRPRRRRRQRHQRRPGPEPDGATAGSRGDEPRRLQPERHAGARLRGGDAAGDVDPRATGTGRRAAGQSGGSFHSAREVGIARRPPNCEP